LYRPGIDDDLRVAQEPQCIAIRRRLCHAVRCNIAGGAGDVLDQDRLSPCLGEFLAEQTRDDVGRATGRKTDDDADRLFG